jgi:hypothetical protein
MGKFKMRTHFFIFLLIASLSFWGCTEETEIVGGGPGDDNNGGDTNNPSSVLISGQVINNLTGSPLDSAIVLFAGGTEIMSVLSDAQGKYTAELLVSSNFNLVLITAKSGFKSDTTAVFVSTTSNVQVPLIKLVPQGTSSVPSGDPVSIFLSSQSSPYIGVKESGSEETARIVFVVHDSAGVPIDLDHSVDVHFKFGAQPGGGETVSPIKVKTNSNGEAVVNLTSGIKAGAVQIIAEIFLPTKTIVSLPVGIAIHGGLPDNNHFSIAPALRNFAGYNIYGLKNAITAFVGDKYANPVRPNTAVYFTTSGGIVDGSAFTNLQGIGSVELISAAPQPTHPFWGPGFATITASTADENSVTILDSILVLFSGVPALSVSPTSFDIANQGYQSFTYTVSDQHGNPLASGTTISVIADGEEVEVQGDTQIVLPDTQSKGWTQFGFTLVDTDKEPVTRHASVKISVTGPNGGATRTISGIVR